MSIDRRIWEWMPKRTTRARSTTQTVVAAAIIAALGDRPGRAHLRTLADRLDRCARVCWRQQHPDGEDVKGGNHGA